MKESVGRKRETSWIGYRIKGKPKKVSRKQVNEKRLLVWMRRKYVERRVD